MSSRSLLPDFSRRGLLRVFLALPARFECSDLDLGMAEEMQSANKFSSSSLVLLSELMERELREELKDLLDLFRLLGSLKKKNRYEISIANNPH